MSKQTRKRKQAIREMTHLEFLLAGVAVFVLVLFRLVAVLPERVCVCVKSKHRPKKKPKYERQTSVKTLVVMGSGICCFPVVIRV